ncbi:transposase [Pontibacter sp. 13R65]|uniref:transposase n=1 Tax=Pontibacter sp. 13R65 TaxID=3127458 RepID=UPI00301BD0D8
MKKAFAMKAEQHLSNVEILEWLSKMGLRLTKQRISEIFKNSFYCDVITHSMLGEEVVQGKHEKPTASAVGHPENNGVENQDRKKDDPSPAHHITAPEHQLKRLKRRQQRLNERPKGAIRASHEMAQLLSNKTHYSPHDPDARISVKPGKARKLNYHCSLAVDTAKGVISHIRADFANGRDGQHLPSLTMQVQSRLKANALLMQDLLADAGYSNGSNYCMLEQQGITGWIPVFGMYKPEIVGFSYDKERDRYFCPMGKPLPFKGFDHTPDGRLMKHYRASPADCRQCPNKPNCAPRIRYRKITRTAYDEQYQRAYGRQASRRGKQMKKLRQSTVEPVFGSLVQHYGLRKINVLGKSGAHKVMLLAAIAFNLRKNMKFRPTKALSLAMVLEKQQQQAFIAIFLVLFYHHFSSWKIKAKIARPTARKSIAELCNSHEGFMYHQNKLRFAVKIDNRADV